MLTDTRVNEIVKKFTVREEVISQMREEASFHFEKHVQEVSGYSNHTNIPWDFYEAIEESGNYALLVARIIDSEELVGYCGCMIQQYHHAQDVLIGYNDVHYVEKQYRKNGLGLYLLERMALLLKHRGVMYHTISLPLQSDFRETAEKMNYHLMAVQYTRRL